MEKLSRAEVLQHCHNIADRYRRMKLKLTVRQVYYRLVAEGLIESGQKQYKRVVSILGDARYNGTFPLDILEDRSRDVAKGKFMRADHLRGFHALVEDARNLVDAVPSFLVRADRWFGQDTFVSVWVEKEALAGIFEDTCKDLGVSWQACKGYPSIQTLYEWLKNAREACHPVSKTQGWRYDGLEWFENHKGSCKRAVVLYFGDHDPDGVEIPEAAERSIETLQGVVPGKRIQVEFKRIALNMDQIEQNSPPPFFAKETSARYQSYVDKYDTEDAWELDALDPPVLQQLIQDAVAEYWDEDVHNDVQREVTRARSRIQDKLGIETSGEEE